ncbi:MULTISPECIES: hypothetical protein, partial [unclassified Caballeronia]|uniref:hypothetical protein n=1 Tax=unclassified Caballeronia TaxID=2646786 RepID=UPI0020278C2C
LVQHQIAPARFAADRSSIRSARTLFARLYLAALVIRWFPLQTQRQRVALCRRYFVLNQCP